MDAAITIQEFGQLLQNEQEESPLLRVLRSLQFVERPAPVHGPIKPDGGELTWMGWW